MNFKNMVKQPFTPAGLNSKTLELYALSDIDLLAQAKILSNNFKSFMSDNFTFTASQASYLAGVSDAATTALGGLLSGVVVVRGGITMDPVPANPEPARPKEIKCEPHGYFTYNNNVPTSAGVGGTLNIHISWTLL